MIRPGKYFFAVTMVILLLTGIITGRFVFSPSDTFGPLPRGITANDVQDARLLARSVAVANEEERPSTVWIQLAAWAFERENYATAAECYARIPDEHAVAFQARTREGEVRFRLQQAAASEDCLTRAITLGSSAELKALPEWYGARDWLRNLFEIEVRLEERHALLAEIHEHGKPSLFDSVAWCFPSQLRWNREETIGKLEGFWSNDARHPVLRLALARYRMSEGRLDEAASILAEESWGAVDSRHVIAARMMLLEYRSDWEAMKSLLDTLPPVAVADPWLLLELRGRTCSHFQDPERATLAYEKLLAADPASSAGCIALAKIYRDRQQIEAGSALLKRSETLARIQNRLGKVLYTKDVEDLVAIAEMCLEVDLPKHAYWMAYQALASDSGHGRAREIVNKLGS